MRTFPLRIGTPDGLLFEGEVQRIVCRSITGDLAILAGHCNFCTALGMGEAHVILENGTSRSAACIGGMLTVMDGNCSLLATTWEWKEDINEERAQAARKRAEEMIAKGGHPLLAADAQFGTAANDVDMVNGAWNLERLAGVYADFVDRYQPVLDALQRTLAEQDAARLNVQNGQKITVQAGEAAIALPVQIIDYLPAGYIGYPVGLAPTVSLAEPVSVAVGV